MIKQWYLNYKHNSYISRWSKFVDIPTFISKEKISDYFKMRTGFGTYDDFDELAIYLDCDLHDIPMAGSMAGDKSYIYQIIISQVGRVRKDSIEWWQLWKWPRWYSKKDIEKLFRDYATADILLEFKWVDDYDE